jgi:hypothetical protein
VHLSVRALNRRLGPPVAAGVLILGSVVAVDLAASPGARPALAAPATPTLAWEKVLPGATIRESSATPGVLDGAGNSVVVGSLDGKVYAFHESDGSATPGWPVQTSNGINSSASIADTNGDGAAEVFIGSGRHDQSPAGALYSFTHDGRQRFRQAESSPGAIGAPPFPETAVHTTPALGDISHSGVVDVVSPGLGLQAYAYSESGGLLGGWPYYTDDTVFSSPALVDVNGDGITDTVFGGDSSPGGPIDHKGGVVRAVDGGGGTIWQHFVDEQVRGAPAVGDIDGSGQPSIVFGTGDFWFRNGGSPDSTSLFALNRDGSQKWRRDLGSITLASPGLADVRGGGRLDVVMGTADIPGRGGTGGRIYVLDGSNGTPLPQFNGVVVADSAGHPAGPIIGGITTADLTGGGYQSLLVPTGGGVFAYDGRSGTELWGIKTGQVGYQNSPLVTDDGNGTLGITVAGTDPNGNGVVSHYKLATGGKLGNLAWPMFHKDARHTGSFTNPPLTQSPCPAAGGGGYWMVATDGGLFSFCDARFFGSTGAIHLNRPVVGMAPTPDGGGYWLVASDGGIFSFGNARFFGSTGAIALNKPIVGMASTPDGGGYWLVASDGGIFAFGNARFFGSTGAVALNKPIVGMASTKDGAGYWLVASDGGIFAFGNGPFFGSTGAIHLNRPIVGMARTRSGAGYWLVASDGGIFSFGNAPFLGSTGSIHLNQPIVDMAVQPG